MASDEGAIIAMAENAKQTYVSSYIGEAAHIINGLKLFMRFLENLGEGEAVKDEWSLNFDEARNTQDDEIREGKLAVVRYIMDYEEALDGEIMQTTETAARLLVEYGIAVQITEEEAVEYGRKRRASFGGWMDDPAWVRFRDNYKRLCRAVAA